MLCEERRGEEKRRVIRTDEKKATKWNNLRNSKINKMFFREGERETMGGSLFGNQKEHKRRKKRNNKRRRKMRVNSFQPFLPCSTPPSRLSALLTSPILSVQDDVIAVLITWIIGFNLIRGPIHRLTGDRAS